MVIQIPNPLLLPQSYGMGEVAGMSFGSNYVIMMQIGYRYYAPRIIEEMEKDKLTSPMGTVWWNHWQKFMLTYSDKSIQNTMDRTLEIPEKVLNTIWDKMERWLGGDQGDDAGTTLTSASALGRIQNVRYGGRTTSDPNDQLQKLYRDLEDLTDYINSFDPNLKISDDKRKQEERDRIERNTRISNQRIQASQQKAADERNKATARAVSAITPTLTKRKASQSQILERNKLIKIISDNQRWYASALKTRGSHQIGGRSVPATLTAAILKYKKEFQRAQTSLTVLLTRYKF